MKKTLLLIIFTLIWVTNVFWFDEPYFYEPKEIYETIEYNKLWEWIKKVVDYVWWKENTTIFRFNHSNWVASYRIPNVQSKFSLFKQLNEKWSFLWVIETSSDINWNFTKNMERDEALKIKYTPLVWWFWYFDQNSTSYLSRDSFTFSSYWIIINDTSILKQDNYNLDKEEDKIKLFLYLGSINKKTNYSLNNINISWTFEVSKSTWTNKLKEKDIYLLWQNDIIVDKKVKTLEEWKQFIEFKNVSFSWISKTYPQFYYYNKEDWGGDDGVVDVVCWKFLIHNNQKDIKYEKYQKFIDNYAENLLKSWETQFNIYLKLDEISNKIERLLYKKDISNKLKHTLWLINLIIEGKIRQLN